VRRAARDDLAAFADVVRGLEAATRVPAAADAYSAAVAAYERAERSYDRARTPEELEPVAATLADGWYELTRARALLAGSEPPARRPPCFFDPRHGQSTRDVEWAPDGSAPRRVAACAADAELLAQGAAPATRHVLVDGRAVPYWDAPPSFAPWLSGYYPGR
jgi:hypothetical protein